MNNDRELLELAAKAAGIEYGWQHIYDDYEGSTSEKWDWNPLKDDGDALQLAVKLGLLNILDMMVKHIGDKISDYDKDYGYAVRLTIVRAAAAIGETIA
jgi:hypothetical protein